MVPRLMLLMTHRPKVNQTWQLDGYQYPFMLTLHDLHMRLTHIHAVLSMYNQVQGICQEPLILPAKSHCALGHRWQIPSPAPTAAARRLLLVLSR